MSDLIHCIYASAEQVNFPPAELAELLRRARVNNALLGISGMLLYSNGSFFQVLEGEAARVDALFAKITADPRHQQVTLIIREPIPRRAFGDWSMGFFEAAPDAIEAVDGFRFVSGASFAKLDHGRAKKLLLAFSEGRWRRSLGAQKGGAQR